MEDPAEATMMDGELEATVDEATQDPTRSMTAEQLRRLYQAEKRFKEEGAKAQANLATRVNELVCENLALRRGISLMHRRAQKCEGSIHRLEKARESFRREANEILEVAHAWRRDSHRWEELYEGKREELERIPGWIRALFA